MYRLRAFPRGVVSMLQYVLFGLYALTLVGSFALTLNAILNG